MKSTKVQVTDDMLTGLLPEQIANFRIMESRGWYIEIAEGDMYALRHPSGYPLRVRMDVPRVIQHSYWDDDFPDYLHNTDLALSLTLPPQVGADTYSLTALSASAWSCSYNDKGYLRWYNHRTPALAICGMYARMNSLVGVVEFLKNYEG